MKTIASITVLMLALLFAPANLMAQGIKSKQDTVKIQTSAECAMCKTKLENEVGRMKGVKSVNVDLKTQIATVVYNNTKTSPDKIRTVIANAGYDADEVKANNRAKNKLPACCKPGGMPANDSAK